MNQDSNRSGQQELSGKCESHQRRNSEYRTNIGPTNNQWRPTKTDSKTNQKEIQSQRIHANHRTIHYINHRRYLQALLVKNNNNYRDI